MLRMKIFSSGTQRGEVGVLESEIDGWLQSERPAIRRVMQSSSPGVIVLSFLYDDGRHDAQESMAGAVMSEAFAHGSDDNEFDALEDEPDALPEAELPY